MNMIILILQTIGPSAVVLRRDLIVCQEKWKEDQKDLHALEYNSASFDSALHFCLLRFDQLSTPWSGKARDALDLLSDSLVDIASSGSHKKSSTFRVLDVLE